jgi:salicylate hydroxylase
MESMLYTYRCSIDERTMLADPMIAHPLKEVTIWVGAQRIVVAAHFRGDFGITLPHPGDLGTAGDWTKAGDLNEMRELYKDAEVQSLDD